MSIPSVVVRSLVIASWLVALQIGGCINFGRSAPGDLDAIADGDAGADVSGDTSADAASKPPMGDAADTIDTNALPDPGVDADADTEVDAGLVGPPGLGNACTGACATGLVCVPKVDGKATCEFFPGGVCKVCMTDADCPVAKARCLPFLSGGKFCGSPCGLDTDCLSGFICTSNQCRPDATSCECTPELVGFSLGCVNQNTDGICRGATQCGEGGWSMCSAQPPSPERCDDLDNDCDGTTDEGFPTKGQPCDGPDLDECAEGKWVCSGDGASVVCDEKTATTAEVCDGKDNDCDGDTDEQLAGCVWCAGIESPCPAGFACESDAWCVSVDGLEVYVPSGRFWMGCNATLDGGCQVLEHPGAALDENPQHKVDVPAYFIDRYEVTAAAYKAWCPSGPCLPKTTAGADGTYDPLDKQSHPINWVTWFQSGDYCEAQGKRLCSESEWEKAARGGCELYCPLGDDACCKMATPTYPWGEAPPTCAFAVMEEGGWGCGAGATSAVGSKLTGASPYGVMDMAGNVTEWVQDCAHDSYDGAPTDGSAWTDLGGYCVGGARVHRGGAFVGVADTLRAGFRFAASPGLAGASFGFRCCRAEP